MADPLRLLFELDADGEPSVKEFKRVASAFATEIQGMKRLAESAVRLSVAGDRQFAGSGAASAVTAAQQKQNASLAELDRQRTTAFVAEERARTAAAEALQRQRSAAIIGILKQQQKDEDKQRQAQQASAVRSAAQTAAQQIQAALTASKGTEGATSIVEKAVESLGEKLNLFVGERLPIVGGGFVRITENLRAFGTVSKNIEGSVLRLGRSINDLSQKSGRSSSDIQGFLLNFTKLGSQAEKDAAAIEFFGASLAQQLTPQLASASAEMETLASGSVETGGALAGLAGPAGIAVLAVAAVVAVTTAAIKKMFDLAESTAEAEGRFKDLSQQLGLSADTLSTLAIVASDTGGDIGAITAALGIFQKHLDDARDPLSQSAGLLGELGIQTRDTESALRQAFTTLARMPEGFEQTAAALNLFGRGGKTVLALIKETNGDLDSAVKKYKALGEAISDEDAEAADRFNDALNELHRSSDALIRQLGREFLPAALEIVTALTELVRQSKGWFDLLGFIGRPVIDTFADGLRGLSLVLAVVRQDAETTAKILKDLEDRKTIAPIQVPDITPVPLPTGEESALQKAGEEAVKIKAEVSEAIRFAESQMAAIDRQLKLREISPSEALEPIIALEKAKTEAVIKELQHRRDEEANAFVQDQKARNERDKKVQDLDEQIRNEESKLDQLEADKRAEFRAQELQREQAHRRALADIFVKSLNDRIAALQRSAQVGANSELFAQDVTTRLLEASFAKRKEVLEAERAEAGKDPALAQQINAQLADLQRERTATLKEQADRRITILRDEQQKTLDLQRSQIDSFLRAASITDESQIATIKSLAALRVKTEEQAAQQILKLRLDANAREIEVAKSEQQTLDKLINQRVNDVRRQREALEGELNTTRDPARGLQLRSDLVAAAVAETDAVKKANEDKEKNETDFNNKLRVLRAQRSQIQAQGNRDIDDARQQDLDNQRSYNEELERLHERTLDIQRDAAREAIRLLQIRHASRLALIREQRDLELKEEEERHKAATKAIKAQQDEVDTQIKTFELLRDSIKIGTTEEIEQYEHLIQKIEELKVERAELAAQQQAEDERSANSTKATTDEAERAIDALGPLKDRWDEFKEGVLNANDSIAESMQSVSAQIVESFDNMVDALKQGIIGWELYGDSLGKALKSALAQQLAAISAECVIQALKHAAYALGSLAFGDFAGAAKHAAAAAAFAAAAAATGFAARGLAKSAGLFHPGGSAGTASAAVNGGEPSPRNATFNFGGQPIESSSQALRDGSNTPFGRLGARLESIERQNLEVQRQQQLHNALVSQALTKLNTARPGDVVTVGAPDARQAIGVAVIDHSRSDGEFVEQMQRNLGFAR